MNKKIVLLGATCGICVFSLMLIALYFFNFVSEGLSKEQDRCKKYIGATVVLQSDSLKVVDYSLFGGTFTLSNGVKVDTSFVFNQK